MRLRPQSGAAGSSGSCTRWHDAAAATLGALRVRLRRRRRVRQLDHILRIDPLSGRVACGPLACPEQRLRAASIGGVAYIVGGYTGTRWLDTIVAFRRAERARRRAPSHPAALWPPSRRSREARDAGGSSSCERIGLARRLRVRPYAVPSRVASANCPMATTARRRHPGRTRLHHRRARRCRGERRASSRSIPPPAASGRPAGSCTAASRPRRRRTRRHDRRRRRAR